MLKIKDWDHWQSYRKDRGTPPWIKIHRSLLSNSKWAVLTDQEKGQIVSIWIVAADKNGEIPSDIRILRKVCQLDEEPNIQKFVDLGFILRVGCHDDVNMTSSGCQRDVPEERRGEERREEVNPLVVPPSEKKQTKGKTNEKTSGHKFDAERYFTESWYNIAVAKGIEGDGLADVCVMFKDYYTIGNGKSVKSTDRGWDARWRKWISNESTNFGRGNKPNGGGTAAQAHFNSLDGWNQAVTAFGDGDDVSN